MPSTSPEDTPALRKARGAFFTPQRLTSFMAEWAIRDEHDRVLEPSAGDAEFMVAAVRRLQSLTNAPSRPSVDGVEMHGHSAEYGAERVRGAGGDPTITVSDFFDVVPQASYDVVIGNPPYIRYQHFSGDSRIKARAAALRGGVRLSGLASSWAAFVVYSAQFLKEGGRLALVLPAELLSVNYASPVRTFLFQSFSNVEVVMFEEQVFPEAEADVVLLLASGYALGPTDTAQFRQTRNADTLDTLPSETTPWSPPSPGEKWTGSLTGTVASEAISKLEATGQFVPLETWGDTTLGIVTGRNSFFTLSPEDVRRRAIADSELLRLSPPGSAHLRGLTFTPAKWKKLGEEGRSTYLFRPTEQPSEGAMAYLHEGVEQGVDQAYKCRVRKVWYQVPLVKPCDLFLTYMNADAPRLCSNDARAYHLNSVHGLYLHGDLQDLGRDLLPIASLNAASLLHAELIGRAYGGGLLKLEPREADRWLLPSPERLRAVATPLRELKPRVSRLLAAGRLQEASQAVDEVLLDSTALTTDELNQVRAGRDLLASRRKIRGASGR